MRGTGLNNDRGGSCPLCTYSTVGSGWKGKGGKENGRKKQHRYTEAAKNFVLCSRMGDGEIYI